MEDPSKRHLIWWVIPGVLAGMPMPFIHPKRHLALGASLTAFEDELPTLYSAGVRAVVSLLNTPIDIIPYGAAGIGFLCLPIQDGAPPTMQQADEFVRYVNQERAAQRPVAVHCEAGRGRTGTMLAVYLISQGETARAALHRVRMVEPVAVETAEQVLFLGQFEERK
jgi:hypothetical protein